MTTPAAEEKPSLLDVLISVVRLEGKMDGMAQAQSLAQTSTDQRLADHEKRIRTVERARWPLASVATLATVAAVVVPLLHWR